MKEAERHVGNFPSKKDGWLVSLFCATSALEVIAAAALISVGPTSLWLSRGLPVLLVASACFILWSVFGTSYRVEGPDLVIRSGPFKSRVPIASIESMVPTHSVNAAMALSTHRLDLRCANSTKHVLVSPDEPTAFITALRNVNPTIVVGGGVQARA